MWSSLCGAIQILANANVALASPGIRRFTWRQSQVFPVWIDRLNDEVADWKDDVGIEPWTRDEASLWADSFTAANQHVYAAK